MQILYKLNWLLAKKKEISRKINQVFRKVYPTSKQLNPDGSLDTLNTRVGEMKRNRLVPVMTMYMPYTYGNLNGAGKYVPLKWYNSSYNFVDTAIDKVYTAYGPDVAWDNVGKAPVLSRDAEGVVTGTMPNHKYTAVHNQPFVMGVGVDNHLTSESRWRYEILYSSLSYFYPESRGIKILLADDNSKNDGTFILGNIALVDPSIHPEVREDALVQLVKSYYDLNASSASSIGFGDVRFANYINPSNMTEIVIGYGSNDYEYIWPVVTGDISKENARVPVVVSIKKIKVLPTTTTMTVATGYGNREYRGGFHLEVYGKPKI